MTSTELRREHPPRRRIGSVIAGVAIAAAGAFAIQAFTAGAVGEDASTFRPITPCRLADTRPELDFHEGPNTTLGPGATVTFQATGINGQCAIPTTAVGLSLNVTALNAWLPTHLTIWPGGVRPNASSINPVPGEVAVNAVTTPLSNVGSFDVYNLQGAVDVIIDVNGYYTDTTITQLAARVTELEATVAPATFEAINRDPEVITPEPRGMVSMTPPDWWIALMVENDSEPIGNLVVNYALTVEQDEPGVQVECWLVGGAFHDDDGLQIWESPGTPGGVGQISGTAMRTLLYPFDFPSLSCSHTGTGDPTIASNIVMTAVFTTR